MFGNGFYNPYMYQPYYQTANMARNVGGLAGASLGRAGSGLASGGFGSTAGAGIGSGFTNLGKGLFSKFSFSGFLNGASKTLNVVNQAIPIFYQVRPIINNARTMFRIMGAVKDDDRSSKSIVQQPRNNNTIPTTSSNTTRATRDLVTATDEVSQTDNPVFFI